MIDIAKARKFIDQCWGDEIVPTLVEYIRIPNKSSAFDPDWVAHGFMRGPVPAIIHLPNLSQCARAERIPAHCDWSRVSH